jgi:branched-chain amino acid transport system permease protein
MMGVLNFAHASFYMLGAYVAYTVRASSASGRRCCSRRWSSACSARCSSACLRRVHKFGHVPELLITFGLST